MRRSKIYERAKFSPETIKTALRHVQQAAGLDAESKASLMSVKIRGATWDHDTEEEFFSDYRECTEDAHFAKAMHQYLLAVDFRFGGDTKVDVQAPDRALIGKVFEIFEEAFPTAQLPEPPRKPEPKPVVFIGHGSSIQWRDLKDHLQDQHGYTVEGYEVGARAGHTIRDILKGMMRRSSFAILLMTGDDETRDGRWHPRLNVVHEAGLFQGHLGFARAVILLEEGVEEFSNIHGLQQIRFTKGNIREAFGDVLATLRREFAPAESEE